MIKKIFSWFESRIDPYPEAAPKTPEKGLWRFIWSNIEGVRKWIAVLAVFTVGVGIDELDVPIYGQGGRLARRLYAANAFC